MNKLKLQTHHYLAIAWAVISLAGAVFIFSASYIELIVAGASMYSLAIKQLVLFFAGFVVLILIYKKKKIAYALLKNTSKFQFYFTIVCLFIVIIPVIFKGILPAGIIAINNRNGAHSVIPLIVFDFQPLEYFKITMILYFAYMMSRTKRLHTFAYLRNVCIAILIGAIFIFLEPDTGGFLIIVIVLLNLIVINGEHIKVLFKAGGYLFLGAMALAIPTIIMMFTMDSTGSNYKFARILSWVNPAPYIEGISMNMVNSLTAVSNGGLLGSGFMNSIQKSGYLYGKYTDFIFVIIVEEWGVIGGVVVIGMLLAIAVLCYRIGSTASDRFGQIYCYGFALLIIVQSGVNIGGVTGVIPMTGVTLPFISSGMNSYIFLTMGLFFVIIIDLDSQRKKRIDNERSNSLFM